MEVTCFFRCLVFGGGNLKRKHVFFFGFVWGRWGTLKKTHVSFFFLGGEPVKDQISTVFFEFFFLNMLRRWLS